MNAMPQPNDANGEPLVKVADLGDLAPKGLKVVKIADKSPYINNCFNKNAPSQTSASNSFNPSDSESSSAKANNRIVLKKVNKSSAMSTGQSTIKEVS